MNLSEDKKKKAHTLRSQGQSLSEIASELSIAKSTASLWLRDVVLSKTAKEIIAEKQFNGRLEGRKIIEAERNSILEHIDQKSTLYIQRNKPKSQQYKAILALLYGCEGVKRSDGRVVFVNSDPELIGYFISLLRKAFTIDESKFRILMHLHGYHNEKKQKAFWSKITAISENQFSRTFWKSEGKKNKREGYQGCISLRYNDKSVQTELVMVYRKLLAGP